MKQRFLMLILCFVSISAANAVEIVRWDRVPLPVSLIVDQERVILIDRPVRVGMPALLSEQLRVQSAGGALYLRANTTFEPTRVQLQDTETGALILLDVKSQAATAELKPLEPLRILDAEATNPLTSDTTQIATTITTANRSTPVPVVLTRFAAQNLYAPLRTVEALPGVSRVSLRTDLMLDTLLPIYPVRARALVAWRLDDYWVTAIKLTNTAPTWIDLDPRALQGDFLAATFQHPNLGPEGDPQDTTVVYLVTRGHGLAESLLPAINPIDPSRSGRAP